MLWESRHRVEGTGQVPGRPHSPMAELSLNRGQSDGSGKLGLKEFYILWTKIQKYQVSVPGPLGAQGCIGDMQCAYSPVITRWGGGHPKGGDLTHRTGWPTGE